MDQERNAPLTVARIPALVREVDGIEQTLAASALPSDPEALVVLCESLLARIEEIDAFRQTLRAGPLEAIVQKQVTRLSTVLERIHTSGSKKTARGVNPNSSTSSVAHGALIDKRRRRQIVPIMGSLLIKRVPNLLTAPGSASKQLTVRLPRHPKPIYKWERRRSQQFPALQPPSRGNAYSSHDFMDDDINEACTELQPCREPGHYVRASMAFTPLVPEPAKMAFEFQIILTEAEVQALKYQRRQMQAEQRHLKRQQSKSS